LFVVPLSLPPRILLLGAGPDAVPVVDFAARLDWKVTLVDHRPAYAVASHFPAAERVLLARPDALPAALDLSGFAAAVVMSHHLPSDLAYLRALAATGIAYVGLLGPAARREKLLSDLGTAAHALRGRLRAPVGLPLVQFRQACVDYLVWDLAQFEERDQRLAEVWHARLPSGHSARRAVDEALSRPGRSREALARLEAALAEPLAPSPPRGAQKSWQEFVQFFNTVWSARRDAIE